MNFCHGNIVINAVCWQLNSRVDILKPLYEGVILAYIWCVVSFRSNPVSWSEIDPIKDIDGGF